MNRSNILIIADDLEFARTLAACWQTQRSVPAITIAASDVWHASIADTYALVIVGPVCDGKLCDILATLGAESRTAAISVVSDGKTSARLQAEHPHLGFVPLEDGWPSSLIAISTEALRRIDAVARAQRAERLALENQSFATLGRYMLEMRPNVNNALTSVLGNADLLLLNPAPERGDSREQIEAIHAMALRLNEIMQRFSSLASEVRLNEKESQTETGGITGHLVERL